MTTKTKRLEKAPPPADSLLLTIPEAGELLRLSRGTIYSLVDDDRLELVKIGKSARITRRSAERLANQAAG